MRSTLRRLLVGTTITQLPRTSCGCVNSMFPHHRVVVDSRTDSISVLNHRSRTSLRRPDPADRWWGSELLFERHLELQPSSNKLLFIYFMVILDTSPEAQAVQFADRDDSYIHLLSNQVDRHALWSSHIARESTTPKPAASLPFVDERAIFACRFFVKMTRMGMPVTTGKLFCTRHHTVTASYGYRMPRSIVFFGTVFG
ncbi:Putative protein of unknown function [Podospora comata]|uniref:Uncharacterized protein n=1 Tax=Podospora comata TaxID=48703 RepID=A0ABY6S5J6_PODCO|nr:Putative protein of unknown function [Podospora comata]